MIRVDREKRELVVMKGAHLPPVCLKCASQSGLVLLRHEFSWAPDRLWSVTPVGLLKSLVLWLDTRRTATLDLPLCGAATRATNTEEADGDR